MLHKINIMSQLLILTLSKQQKILSSYWKFCFLEKSIVTLISQSNFASLSPIQCYHWTVFWGASCFNAHLNYFVFVNKQNMPRTRTKSKLVSLYCWSLSLRFEAVSGIPPSSLVETGSYCAVHAALSLLGTKLATQPSQCWGHNHISPCPVWTHTFFCFVAGSLYIAHLDLTM